MDLSVELGPAEVSVVLLQQQLARLLIEGRLWVGDYQETFDGEEDVLDAQVRFPVFLECVDANLSGWSDIRVKYFGQEET